MDSDVVAAPPPAVRPQPKPAQYRRRPPEAAGMSKGLAERGAPSMSTDSNHGAATITEHEGVQVARANATGRRPVVFVPGLWLLPRHWDRLAASFHTARLTPLTPHPP